jgi:hypothetical protein
LLTNGFFIVALFSTTPATLQQTLPFENIDRGTIPHYLHSLCLL